jgi:TfoX/Sxy family transcriptional regulator of competence genes
MASRKDTADFILEHLGLPAHFSVRPMFGEFALYADGKPVGFICDDQLFVKIMPESVLLEGRCERAPAYPGSKDYYLVPEDLIAGESKLAGVLLRIGEALPLPKSKRSKKRS